MSRPEVINTVHHALVQVFSELDAWCLRPRLDLRPERPGAWSGSEHLEHVSLVNHFLLLTIGKGCATALRRAARLPIPGGESDLAPLSPVAEPGAFDWPPPAHMLPLGLRPVPEVRLLLADQRGRCLELLAGMPSGEGRLCTINLSVHGLGRLDMYQWLYFLAQHARYHLNLLPRLAAA